MMRSFFLGLGLLLMAWGVALASSNPAADALRQQIKALRAEEKANVKAVQAQYDSVIHGDKLSEQQLREQRLALDAQEKQALAVAGSAQDRSQIRSQLETLRKALLGQSKLDASQVAQLRAQRKAHAQQIASAYKAQIAQLEAQLRAMPRSTGSRTKR